MYFSIKMKPSCGFIGNEYKKIGKLSCMKQDHLEAAWKRGNVDQESWGRVFQEQGKEAAAQVEELTCGNSIIVSKHQ